MSRLTQVLALFWIAIGPASRAVPAQEPPIDFARDVRPILSRHCFKCHGPDDKARKSRLRLDLREEALKKSNLGARPIVPGRPAESEIVRRVFSADDDERMPPPAAKIPLTEAQRETLRRWIAAGAEYTPHWAFLPPRAVRPPEGAGHPIDAFLLARLRPAGLTLSPPADPRTLVRRVSLDLIGLPPTPEEAEAFARDGSPEAYERLVDRLLASPHYGERWAKRWLDLARYADTNGYEKDRPRSMWPWRDWVIDAINRDLPFDRFTLEQVAGDMLGGAAPGPRIATGFHRNTMINEEGGIDPLEFRFHAMTDRVATTGRVWLGLTVGCAQCHTHKFDPVTQREYYGLMAFMNNADEPELAVPSPDVVAQRAAIEARIEALVAELPGKFPGNLEGKLTEWIAREEARSAPWRPLRPAAAKANLPVLTVQADDSVFASGDQTKSDTYELRFAGGFRGVTALRLEALPDERLPRNGPGRTYYEGPIGDFTLCDFAVDAGGGKVRIAKATHSFAADKFLSANAVDDNPQTGWSVNGGQGRRHSAVFRLAEPLDAGEFAVRMLFERHFSAGLGRFRISATTRPDPPDARDLPAEVEEILLVPAADRTAEQRARLLRQFTLVAPELAAARKEIDRLRQEVPAFPTTLVLAERDPGHPRETFLHRRGEFLQPLEKVEPGLPAALRGLPAGAPRNRLAFARWLVSPENPLVGRVTMNRQWAAFFGKGLVRTPEDFGFQGELPSHPELLDWLALEFVRQGWSMKRMQRLIVTSAAYRQSARATPELLARDPENRLLGRFPRTRLEAEAIRDAALRAAGLLSPRVGGPSVYPPQPASITKEGAYGPLEWKVSQGEDRYRRGLYTFMKRTAPYAQFSTFDAPSGEACVVQREVSNTPLQALTLLNDPVFMEAARALGRRLAAEPEAPEERAARLFSRILTRPPAPAERARLVEFLHAQRARFEAGELDAAAVAGTGSAEAAAWTVLARALFNLDEAITKE